VITQVGKDLRAEGDRVVYSEKVIACLGAEDELNDGVPLPPSFVPGFKVSLDRCQSNGANYEGDQQS